MITRKIGEKKSKSTGLQNAPTSGKKSQQLLGTIYQLR